MATQLNKKALEHAQGLLRKGDVVRDERDDWSEHAPSTDDENAFIDEYGMDDLADDVIELVNPSPAKVRTTEIGVVLEARDLYLGIEPWDVNLGFILVLAERDAGGAMIAVDREHRRGRNGSSDGTRQHSRKTGNI